MSRLGRNPVELPKGVTIEVQRDQVIAKGPKGTLAKRFHPYIEVVVSDGKVVVTPKGASKFHKSLHGLTRAIINNMVLGVTRGYQKELSIVGVGYKAELQGKRLNLVLGYSHPIMVRPPEGVSFAVDQGTRIMVSGIDKELVGEIAAKIRALRPPEPYKGKGIRYVNEVVRHKAGKTAA